MEIKAKEIELVSVDSLIPHPKNANTHSDAQIDRLCQLIKYQGWRNPLVVQKGTNLIVAGHGRAIAAKKLGMSHVPVTYQEFESEAQLYAFLVSDNTIASWAEINMDQVKLEIENFPDLDIEILGMKEFGKLEIEDIDFDGTDDINKDSFFKKVMVSVGRVVSEAKESGVEEIEATNIVEGYICDTLDKIKWGNVKNITG